MNSQASFLRVFAFSIIAIQSVCVCLGGGLNLAPKRGSSNQGAFLLGVFDYIYSDRDVAQIKSAHFTSFRYCVNVETCNDERALDRMVALMSQLGNRGIVCMWDTNQPGEVEHGNGRINDVDDFADAWKKLYQRIEPLDEIQLEIFNEPFGYDSAEEYLDTMNHVIKKAGLPKDRCILDGLRYAEDIRSVARAGWTGTLAYHFYPNWLPQGQQTAENYSRVIQDSLADVDNKIVITEFGVDLRRFDPRRRSRRSDKDVAALKGFEDALIATIKKGQRIEETYHWHGWDNHDAYSFWDERNAYGAERIRDLQNTLRTTTQSLASKQTTAKTDQRDRRPNIIWVMAEDISTELSCYDHPAVQTPNMDRLADEGVRYTHAFCTAPSCTPSRNAMITGVYQTRTGTQNQRSKIDQLPEGIRPITSLLQDAGYYTALGCGYSGKTDMMFPATNLFDGNDWSQRAAGQPFFAQITLYHSHRQPDGVWEKIRSESKHPVDPSKVELPPYFPDDPVCRMDWALYLDSIERDDLQLGQIMDRVRAEGIEENTIVIFIGDNGRCHLRGKCWLYDPGLLVPLIIRDPRPDSEKPGKAGTVINDLVSTLDISATVLDLAGVELPGYLDGQTLWSTKPQKRSHVFAARDLIDEVLDPIRCVRTHRYKYIRNYHPENGYRECEYVQAHRPMLPVIERLGALGRLTQSQQLILKTRKPIEELYDVETDPHEIQNLAESPGHQETLIELSALLDNWIETTQDKGLTQLQRSQRID